MTQQNCSLYVDNNDPRRYCCQNKAIRIKPGKCAVISLANVGPVDLLVFPTGDTDDASTVHSTLTDGVTTVLEPGIYKLDLDCAELQGTEAPEDPAKHMLACCSVTEKDDTALILATLEALCAKIVAGDDTSALAEIISNLEAICEKLLAADAADAEIIAELQALCAKMLDVFAAVEAVCEKLEANSEQLTALCDKIEEMSADLIAALQALCDKQDTTNELLTTLCEKIEAQTELLTTELAAVLVCLAALKVEQLEQGETLDSIDECLGELKSLFQSTEDACPVSNQIPDADYNSGIAWVTGRPNTTVPWALIDNRDPDNQAVVASGSTFGAFIANMEAMGYTEWSFGETHYFCPCPPGLVNAGDYFVTADGDTVSKPACTALAELPTAPEKPDTGEPKAALRFIECNSAAILQALLDLCAKQTEPPTVPCLRCAVFSIAADEIVGNVITGVQGGTGQVETFAEPATGPLEFAAQVAALGYTVESVVGNLVTICGAEIIFSYQQEGGTIVPADQLTIRDGLLVCDPAAAANGAKLDALLSATLAGNDLLAELKACLCDCEEDDAPVCVPSVSSENNPEGWSWFTGPTANTAMTFPTPIDTEEPQDIIATIGADCDELEACFGADCGPNIRLRFTFAHQQLGPNHTGFIFNVTGGQAVAVSSNNTTSPTPSGAANQQIGTAAGDPDDATYVDRWVEYLVAKDTLCGEGVQAATGGFQGFDNAGVFDESFGNITVTIEGCE